MDSSLRAYIQPVASHVDHPERLLVRDQDGTFLLWHGNGDPMVEVPSALATWMVDRPELQALPSPRLWFDVESLPMAVELYDSEWSVAD